MKTIQFQRALVKIYCQLPWPSLNKHITQPYFVSCASSASRPAPALSVRPQCCLEKWQNLQCRFMWTEVNSFGRKIRSNGQKNFKLFDNLKLSLTILRCAHHSFCLVACPRCQYRIIFVYCLLHLYLRVLFLFKCAQIHLHSFDMFREEIYLYYVREG